MSLHNTTIFDEFVLWDILYLFCGIDKHSAKCQQKTSCLISEDTPQVSILKRTK